MPGLVAKEPLRGSPLVVMMQTADLRDLDDRTAIGLVGFPSLRAVHLQRPMNAPFMVVAEVRSEDSAQVHLVQDIDDTREARYGRYYTQKRPLTAETLRGRP